MQSRTRRRRHIQNALSYASLAHVTHRICSWAHLQDRCDDASAVTNATTTSGGYNLGLPYMSSLYWSLTTLIKTPWVHPDTILEKVVASVIVVVGAILFAAILGNITAMINSFDKSNAQLRDIMSTLHRLIGKYDVPAKLQKRVFMCAHRPAAMRASVDVDALRLSLSLCILPHAGTCRRSGRPRRVWITSASSQKSRRRCAETS